ncbi:hypothetical protein WA026_015366 [Henosepilachna vigintioctopunctata]|uniref:Uncharacterized protein n=1 Tax=Henosepilachna vigintioctopunctata TaxID=420089 RepID=A0AAW1UJ55_9CUCU
MKVNFKSPNTPSICQPLNQAIIQNDEFYYGWLKLRIIRSNMVGVKSASELAESMSISYACHHIKAFLDKVSSATIRNYIKKTRFRITTTGEYSSILWCPEDSTINRYSIIKDSSTVKLQQIAQFLQQKKTVSRA